jgi:hypothetical protein
LSAHDLVFSRARDFLIAWFRQGTVSTVPQLAQRLFGFTARRSIGFVEADPPFGSGRF